MRLFGAATNEVRVYLSRHPDAEQVLKRLPILEFDPSGEATPDVQGWWKSFEARAADDGMPTAAPRTYTQQSHGSSDAVPHTDVSGTLFPVRQPARGFARWVMASAALVAVMIGGFAYLRSTVNISYTGTTSQSFAQTIVTKAGQHRMYQLPDGSAIMLAPGTTIQYTSNPNERR